MKRLVDRLFVAFLSSTKIHKAIEMEEEKNPLDRCREIIAEGMLSMNIQMTDDDGSDVL